MIFHKKPVVKKVVSVSSESEGISAEGDENTITIEEQTNMKKADKVAMVVYVVLVFMGIGTGYLLTRQSTSSQAATNDMVQSEKVETIKSDKAAGVTDVKTFKDSAEGKIEKGGLSGEGTHKLVRDGGPSQTVYLVSSVLNMDDFEGKKVRVWGQTYAGKKAAWFMDVGKIETLE